MPKTAVTVAVHIEAMTPAQTVPARPRVGRSLAGVNPGLAAQWDVAANGDLTPADVNAGSSARAWWVCPEGHPSFLAQIVSRNAGSGCPVCARIPGGRTLARMNPELAAQWDHEANGSLTPSAVSIGSTAMVWWVCSSGHPSFQARVGKRNEGSKCPVCRRLAPSGRSLAEANPELAAEWDREANRTLTTSTVSAGSNAKVWWVCRAGHPSYAARVFHRDAGSGCPTCGRERSAQALRRPKLEGSLAEVRPDLASEWDLEGNGGLTPSDVGPYSEQAVRWLCGSGHAYEAGIKDRHQARGSGCPECALALKCPRKTLADANPELAAEWDAEANGELTPRSVGPYSRTKIWWICSAGHPSYLRAVKNRHQSGSSCPKCSLDAKQSGNLLTDVNPSLAEQWDTAANGDLTPAHVTRGSTAFVWWTCPAGHPAYQARVYNRTRGNGCPKCAHLRSSTAQRLPGGATVTGI